MFVALTTAMNSVAPTTGSLLQSLNAQDASSRLRQSRLFDGLVSRRSNTTRRTVLQFIFTHRTICRLWLLIVLVQLVDGLQLLILSNVYLSYQPSSSSLIGSLASSFLTSEQKTFLSSHSLTIGITYACLGLTFIASMLSMILVSFQNGRPSFTMSTYPKSLRETSQLISAKPKWCTRILTRKLARCSTSFGLRQAWSIVLLVHGRLNSTLLAFGVRGEKFEEVMLTRETIELFLQAVQASQVCQRVSRPHVNYAYTALIGLNAFLYPAMGRIYLNDPQTKRFAMVFTDFFLDFMWGRLLPIWLYIPYLKLNRSKSAHDLLIENGFGSIENAQREVEQIVILSASALVLSIVPFISALVSLRSLKKLLQKARCIKSWSELTEEERVASLELFGRKSARSLDKLQTRSAIPIVTSSRFVRYGHKLLSLLGALLSVIAIASSGVFMKAPNTKLRVWDNACKYPLTPWLATKPACAVWFLDCEQLGLLGREAGLVEVFALIHKSSLVYLSIERCPHLEINQAIILFRNIRAIAIWNSRLEAWNEETPILDKTFPVLQTILFEKMLLSQRNHGDFRASCSAHGQPVSRKQYLLIPTSLDCGSQTKRQHGSMSKGGIVSAAEYQVFPRLCFVMRQWLSW